ncbi:MAG: nickel pincer cofactor biosynthesis protein LarC [Candidatus Nealsonbacteria bacterium]|nr:MAG: nickel pincer cofactor biosynthesis protein LarC [Candidatus Nealsonbacteria bacterium]
MKTLYFNCQSGISGDMIVGALLDLGISKDYLIKELSKLKIGSYKIEFKKVKKEGVIATRFIVKADNQREERNIKNIYGIIDKSSLGKEVKGLSREIFFNLAKAEAKVHKTAVNKIHFHEVGAVDSIIDIVSSAILINRIKPKKIYASRLSVGRGKIKFSHGITNLPVPAVRELIKEVPFEILSINKELVTPTGAAIIKTITNEFVDDIDIKVRKRGYGAGKRDLKIPNVLEIILGETKMDKPTVRTQEKLTILETNIDDMNPEFYSYVIEKLIKKGAREAFIQPIVMKKGRLGTLFTVICDEKIKDKLIETIFDETTTFGIRINKVSRVCLDREFKKVKTKYGLINVKIGKYKGKVRTVSPEYEDCKKMAHKKDIPIKKVYDEALTKCKNTL